MRTRWSTRTAPGRAGAGRLVVGAVGAVTGLMLFTAAPSLVATAVGALLVVVGADLAIAGALGRPPLLPERPERYGEVTRPVKESPWPPPTRSAAPPNATGSGPRI